MWKLSRRSSVVVSLGLVVMAGFAVALLAQDAGDPAVQADPPSVVARVSVLLGNVSIEPASVDQFSAAEMNYPLTTGDRLYADVGANAELQTDTLAVRLGQSTDLTVTAMTDTLAQFGLAQGSVHLHSFSLDPGQTVEMDTPNIAVTVLQPGDVRVDVDAASDTTTVTVVAGQVEVDGNGIQQLLQAGQRVRLGGSDPVSAQWLYAAQADGLDAFSSDRDGAYASAAASESQYVNPGTIGAEDLSANGDWETDSDYGAVWYPAGVAVDWVPYSCGRWAWIAPWGWTWVGCERWGFAPFHYGRWNRFGQRWGWIPGPTVVRPVYSPGLVVFVGGPRKGIGIADVTAWFPLGPREPYVPWYHASTLYQNRLNVGGIYDRNTVEVRRNYNQRVTAVFTVDASRQYGNRLLATTAVPQTSFAAGKPVTQAALHLRPEDLATAQVLPHPLVTPQRSMVVATPAKAVPARVARPTLTTHEDTSVRPAMTQGGGGGLGIGARPVGPTKSPQGLADGRTSTPVEQQPAPIARQPRMNQPPAAVVSQPAPVGSAVSRPESQPAPERVQPAPERIQPAAEAVSQEQRPLFNRAVPPEPRPSFDQQQKAIQSTDPGRPLSPEQLNNLRQERPAGPPQQREAPHPAPAPRSAPAAAPRPSPPPAASPKK